MTTTTIFSPLTLSLPSHWLPAILYGDTDHLADDEDRAFGLWVLDHLNEFGETHIGTIKADPYFARYHDAAEYGVAACMCHDVELLVAEPEEA